MPASCCGRVYCRADRANIDTRLDVNSAAQGDQIFLRVAVQTAAVDSAAVVGLVQLIACSNVANLFVARAGGGAARWRCGRHWVADATGCCSKR